MRDGDSRSAQARFVARGFCQATGLVFHETCVPTLSTLRTTLACGAQRGVKFRELDFKAAYLNAPSDEETYMAQPVGFKCGTGDLVCKLKR